MVERIFGDESTKDYSVLINNALLSSNPNTGLINVGGFSALNLRINYTFGASTKVIAKPYFAYPSDNTVIYECQNVDTSTAPDYESDDISYTRDVGASEKWILPLPLNCGFIKVVFSGVGATTDRITVSAIAYS